MSQDNQPQKSEYCIYLVVLGRASAERCTVLLNVPVTGSFKCGQTGKRETNTRGRSIAALGHHRSSLILTTLRVGGPLCSWPYTTRDRICRNTLAHFTMFWGHDVSSACTVCLSVCISAGLIYGNIYIDKDRTG